MYLLASRAGSVEWQSMPSLSRMLASLGKGGLVNDITFTSLGGLWVRQAEWALSGDNALICASMASMSAEGVRYHHGTTETLVANETQPVMYCPQVVNNGPLILSVLSTSRQ